MKYNPQVVSAFFRSQGLPEPVYEHRFHPRRKWRFDLCFVEAKIAVEIQGGLFLAGGGRHNRGAALLKEYEKLNEAACLGFRVLYVAPKSLCMMDTVEIIKRAIQGK